VQRGDQWAQTNRYTNRATGTTTRTTRTSEGGAAITRNPVGPGGSGVVRTGSGDVYAGRDGNVYRKGDGGWQKYDNGNWGNVDRPQPSGQAATQARERGTTAGPSTSQWDSATRDQLNRDSAARTEGRQRTNDYSSYRSSSGSRSSGSSYRSSGGASRSGGGTRGGGRRR
jgi:hypothetical protein